MELKEILATVDHTLLTQNATWEEIQQILDDAIHYGTASACIPASYVKQATEYVEGKLSICTVIGFPNGYSTTSVKVFETKDAIANGASEIDMVINVGKLVEGDIQFTENEVTNIAETCHKKGAVLKVIVETCYLEEKNIADVCAIIEKAGADFIKTSTGYGTRGASPEDIKLFKKYLKKNTRIKASGGIRTRADADMYINLGCSRIGTSGGVTIVSGT